MVGYHHGCAIAMRRSKSRILDASLSRSVDRCGSLLPGSANLGTMTVVIFLSGKSGVVASYVV